MPAKVNIKKQFQSTLLIYIMHFLYAGASEFFKHRISFLNHGINYSPSITSTNLKYTAILNVKCIQNIFVVHWLVFLDIIIIIAFMFLDILNWRNRPHRIFDIYSRITNRKLKISSDPAHNIISYWSTWLTAYKLTSSFAVHRRYCLQQELKPVVKNILSYDEWNGTEKIL